MNKIICTLILTAAMTVSAGCGLNQETGEPDRVRHLTKAPASPASSFPREPGPEPDAGQTSSSRMRDEIMSRRESAAHIPTRSPASTARPPATPLPTRSLAPHILPEIPWTIPWLYHPATRANSLAGLETGARDLLREAEQQEQAGNWDQALRLYRTALELQHDHPTILGRAGDAEMAYGDYTQAVPIYRKILGGPEDSTNRIKLATALMLDGQCPQATMVLEATSPQAWTNSLRYSQPAEANWIFAQCLAQEGELNQALAFANATLESAEGQEYPERFEYQVQKLEILLHETKEDTAMLDLAAHGLAHQARKLERNVQEGNCQDAVPRLQELIRKMEGINLPMAHFHTGFCLAGNEQHQEALEYFRNTLQTMPRHPAARTGQAWSLLALEQYQEAREMAQTVLDLGNFSWEQDGSTHVTAHLITARSHAGENNLGLALGAAQEALTTARDLGLEARTEEMEQYVESIQASIHEWEIP